MNFDQKKFQAEFHHLAISVSNIEMSIAFYTNVLGFSVIWDKTGLDIEKVVGLPDCRARQVMLEGYGLKIELFQYFEPKGQYRAPNRQCDIGITHFCLVVDDINQIYKKLLDAGVEFNCSPQEVRPGAVATYFNDLDRVSIELVQYS